MEDDEYRGRIERNDKGEVVVRFYGAAAVPWNWLAGLVDAIQGRNVLRTMTTLVRYIVILTVVAAALYALDRLGLYAERRGWVYYRKKRGSVPLATAVLETQALFDPSKQYVLEATRTDADESESGAPPQPWRRRKPEAYFLAQPRERVNKSPQRAGQPR